MSQNTEIESLQREFESAAAELKEAKDRDTTGSDTTSSDGEHTTEWLKQKTDSLREQILGKLPEEKREAWIAQGAHVLEKYGLVEESKEFTNTLLQRGAELLKGNAELRKTVKSITENPEVQEKMKEKLEELKDSQLSKKGKSAYDTVVNDAETKKLMEEGKKVFGDLLQSEEAKEMMDLSKSLLSEFTSSDMVTSTITKVKTTWNEKGEELTVKGKKLVEKGIETAKKANEGNDKKHKKDKKKKDNEFVEKSSEVLDKVVENRQKIAEMGMKMLGKVQEDDTGRKMIGKGLEYVRKIKEEGGIEGALKKGQAILSDEKQRDEMIEKIKDSVLDFLLKYLPSIEVPVIKFEAGGAKIRLSGIDLSGIKLKSQDVMVRLILNRGKIDGAKLRVGVRNLQIKLKKIHVKIDKNTFPKYKGKASIDGCTKDASFGVAFKLRVVDDKPQLEVQHPYLKLHTLDVTVKHNKAANVLNTLLKWVNPVMCSQLEKLVTKMIIDRSAVLLGPVNTLAVQYWPMLNQMVDTSSMVKGKERLGKDGKVINRDLSKDLNEIEVEFGDGSIGLDLYESYPTEPAVVKVKRFNHGPRNSRLQAEKSGLIRIHDYVIAINGVDVTTMEYDRVIEMMGEMVRPFDVVFGREIFSDQEKSDRSESDSESEEKPKKKKAAKKDSSSESESESSSSEEEKPKKKKKVVKKDSSSEPEEKPKKKKKVVKKESSSESESESESEEKPKKKKATKKDSSSDSAFTESSESEEKPKKKATKKDSSSESESESSSSEEEKKPKKATKKAAKKDSSSSEFSSSSSSSEEEKKPKKATKKDSSSSSSSSEEEKKPKKANKKDSSSSSSSSEEEKPKKKASKKSKKVSSSSSSD